MMKLSSGLVHGKVLTDLQHRCAPHAHVVKLEGGDLSHAANLELWPIGKTIPALTRGAEALCGSKCFEPFHRM